MTREQRLGQSGSRTRAAATPLTRGPPSDFDAAVEHLSAGRLREAETLCRQILTAQPEHVDALHLLGIVASGLGNSDLATDSLEKAVSIEPGHAPAHYNLGLAHQRQGRRDLAAACYRRASEIDPGNAKILASLGAAEYELGDIDQAIACYRRSLEIDPNNARAHCNLGNALKDRGETDAATAAYRRAVEIAPDFGPAHNNLGILLLARDRPEEAETSYRRAIAIDAHHVEAWNNLGIALRDQGRLGEALKACRRAIEIKPDLGDAYANLGTIFQLQGRLEETERMYRRALDIDPGAADTHSNLLLFLHYHARSSRKELLAEHLGWAERHAAPLAATIEPHANDRDPDRRLRVGYVSSDFRTHSVAYFIEPVIAAHDRGMVEAVCYADVSQPDAVTERLRAHADRWRDVCGVGDAALADRIRRDRIDVLVDLGGHTPGNRMAVFARKPAPVQVTYLGYPDTTGLATVDYRLTDAVADPEGDAERFCTEELVRLPGGFLCYRAAENAPPVTDPPALTNGYVTFGSFNYLSKVTPDVIAAWARVLAELPGSRLSIKSKALADSETRSLLEDAFGARGIAPERLELRTHLRAHRDHLLAYGDVDIALDAFPYNGTTTTCEALWMGVPVITLAGETHASRVGASILARVGLGELVAETVDDYVERAADLARNLAALSSSRGGIRDRLARSPLTDAGAFARSLEDAYRTMWRRWCAQAG